MLFNFFRCKKHARQNEESNLYLTKELTWDDEKIIAIRPNGIKKIMYYKDIIRVTIIFDDGYLPVPQWTIQDDNLDDQPSAIDFYNDLQPDLTDLVIDKLSEKLKGYDSEDVHHKIIEAMGATVGVFQLWERDDLAQVLSKLK